MASSSSPIVVKVTCLAMMCLILGVSVMTDAALTCGEVQNAVSSCIPYITGSGGGEVPQLCCDGVNNLNNQAKTTDDRQAACKCIKSAAQILPGINLGNLETLPDKCGVNLPFKLDPSIDCNKIQ